MNIYMRIATCAFISMTLVTWGGDIAAKLDSADGSSAFVVANTNGTVLMRVDSDGRTVAGGEDNLAHGENAAIGGGRANLANGDFSTIAGGDGAVSSLHGQQAYAAGSFSHSGDAQSSTYMMRKTTISTHAQALFLDGGATALVIGLDKAMVFDAQIVASSKSGGLIAGYHIQGLAQNWGGSVRFTGTPKITVLGEDDVTMDAAVGISGPALNFFVTGVENQEIRWVATVRTTEVVFP